MFDYLIIFQNVDILASRARQYAGAGGNEETPRACFQLLYFNIPSSRNTWLRGVNPKHSASMAGGCVDVCVPFTSIYNCCVECGDLSWTIRG